MVGVPERDADLLYACRYACADPIAWFRVRGRSHLLVNDLELAGARRSATVDSVLPLSRYYASLKRKRVAHIDLFRALGEALKERGARRVEVSHDFPAGGLANLRRAGIHPVSPRLLPGPPAEDTRGNQRHPGGRESGRSRAGHGDPDAGGLSHRQGRLAVSGG